MRSAITTIVVLLAHALAASQDNIAVMDLDGAGVSPTDLQGLSDQLRAELFGTGKFRVIERSRMNDILKEQGFQQTGCTNTDCAVEIGQLIGVQEIVVGSINKVGTVYTASVRLVDVATGEVKEMASEYCDECSIGTVLKVTVRDVARRLAGLSGGGGRIGPPPRSTPSPNLGLQAVGFGTELTISADRPCHIVLLGDSLVARSLPVAMYNIEPGHYWVYAMSDKFWARERVVIKHDEKHHLRLRTEPLRKWHKSYLTLKLRPRTAQVTVNGKPLSRWSQAAPGQWLMPVGVVTIVVSDPCCPALHDTLYLPPKIRRTASYELTPQ